MPEFSTTPTRFNPCAMKLRKNLVKTKIQNLFVALAGLALTTINAEFSSVFAQTTFTNNLLVNSSFELPPTGHTLPFGWTRFAPPTAQAFGNYWVDDFDNYYDAATAHSGTFYWKEWGAAYDDTNNVAGIYQTFNSVPGSIYRASGWLYTSSYDELGFRLGTNCYVWLQVEFLDSSSNLLALYKSANYSWTDYPTNAGLDKWIQYQVTNACDLTQPVSVGDPYFSTYAVTGAVSQLVSPVGTAAVRYRHCFLQAANEQGSSGLDDAALEQISGPVPPVITNLYPQYMIFVPPGSGISFNVSSPSGFNFNTNDIHLVLNGTDVSPSLAFSGTSSNWNVFYNGLQSNTIYNVSITVTDSFNFTASANTTFQTTGVGVPAPTYLWEAEDWDFNSDMYIDDPDLCNACCQTNCYFGQVGVQNVDEYTVVFNPNHFYRANDLEATAPSEDYTRPNLYAAKRTDYCINPFYYTEWVNYIRDWPASTNWIIGRFANGSGFTGGATLSLVTPTTTNVLGYFVVPPTPSWSTFQYVYLQDTNLDRQNATVVLDGKETLQLSATLPYNVPGFSGGNPGGNALPTFFMLVPAEVDLPFLSGLYPTGKQPFQYTNALSFIVTTLGATFPASGIQVILDGNNVSSGLVITGSTSSNNVVYPYLAPNQMHTVVINVTNSLGHGISVTNQFDTFSLSNYMFEAEDYDYDGGQYVPSASYIPGCYTSFVSVTNVDFHHTPVSGEPTDGSDFPYRSNGIPQGAEVGDYYRAEIFPSPDYQLIYFGGGDWADYTRDFPPGSYYIYVRTSGLGPYTMTLGQVVSGQGTTNQSLQPLGQWSAVGANIYTFEWVPLTGTDGVTPVFINLVGVTTLQVSTPTGDCYPNYFMLVPAIVPPTITSEPISETLPIGDTAKLAVSALGSYPLHYQWSLDDPRGYMTGATNASLIFEPLLIQDEADYLVIITNAYGSATSTVATLTVLLEPNSYGISNNPSGGTMTVYLANAPDSTNYLYATTNLALPFSQWQLVDIGIAGSNGLFQFIDSQTTGVPDKFYRLSSQLIAP